MIKYKHFLKKKYTYTSKMYISDINKIYNYHSSYSSYNNSHLSFEINVSPKINSILVNK